MIFLFLTFLRGVVMQCRRQQHTFLECSLLWVLWCDLGEWCDDVMCRLSIGKMQERKNTHQLYEWMCVVE